MPAMSIKLLEDYFLIPREKSPFPSHKKMSWSTSQNYQLASKIPGRRSLVALTFDEEDYPAKAILMGKRNLSRNSQDQHHHRQQTRGMKTHANEPTKLALLNHVPMSEDLLCGSPDLTKGDQWRCSLCQKPLCLAYTQPPAGKQGYQREDTGL